MKNTKEEYAGENCLSARINNIFLHSAYFPLKEAEKYVEALALSKGDKVVLYGLGLGYIVKAIKDKFGNTIDLKVFELSKDLYEQPEAFKQPVLKEVLHDSHIEIFIGELNKEFTDKFSDALAGNAKLIIYKPSLETIPEELCAFKEVLKEFQAQKETERQNSALMQHNAAVNESLPGVKHMKDFFRSEQLLEKNIIIVAGGPSLNSSLPYLKELTKNKEIYILTMGTPLKVLIDNGIMPDAFCSTDPLIHVYNQIKDIEGLNIPMCFLNTSCLEAAESYKGPKYIFYNYDNKDIKIECGNSVATAALSIALLGKPKRIILVGQDLAYVDNKRHVDNTVYGKEHYYNVNSSDFLTEGVNGRRVYTNKFFYSVKQWFERRIRGIEEIELINCSSGIRIEGFKEINIENLKEYLKNG